MSLLAIQDLTVRIGRHGPAILDGVSLELEEGEVLGIVGESGSGKSTMGGAVMGLLPAPLVASGRVEWNGRNLLALSQREMRRVRGREISMILQDPMSSLNPVMSVGAQLREALAQGGRPEALAADALAEVRIPSPETRLRAYPHQLSGGMRQRVVSAIALAQQPRLVICDEPTTSLDVTIQFEVLELLKSLRSVHGMSMLFITHDFGVVARVCDRVAVMYAGQIVETGSTAEIFRRPRHWYTRALLASVPQAAGNPERLPVIPGSPPSVAARPRGCPFHPRCGGADEACRSAPGMRIDRAGHAFRCWHPLEAPA